MFASLSQPLYSVNAFLWNLLNLSPAFDTIGHNILWNRLKTCLWTSGKLIHFRAFVFT